MAYKYKAAIIPYSYKDNNNIEGDTLYYVLARANKGGFGYLGGTYDVKDIDIAYTAAREFCEETRHILDIDDVYNVITKIDPNYIIKKTKSEYLYYFYIVPWEALTTMTVSEFIHRWKHTKIDLPECNEKVEIKLIKWYNACNMAYTVRMIVCKLNKLFNNDNKYINGRLNFKRKQ